jgi:hypothetical protein
MAEQSMVDRRLALLKAEVALDFEGLMPALEAGLKFVLVTDQELGKGLDPDVLRRIGGMVMLCNHYGAAVVFVKEKNFAELNSGAVVK